MCARSLQLCPTLCDTMDCSPPGSSVLGTLQATILEEGLPFPSPGHLPTLGIDWSLLHGRQILYHLNHKEAPAPIALHELNNQISEQSIDEVSSFMPILEIGKMEPERLTPVFSPLFTGWASPLCSSLGTGYLKTISRSLKGI